jgi:hypothetical protein
MKKFGINLVLYFVLIFGFFLLYVSNVEALVYGEKNTKPSSKVNFVYQQF